VNDRAVVNLSFALTGRVWSSTSEQRMLTLSIVHPSGRIETLFEGIVPGDAITDDPAMVLREALRLPKVETKPWFNHG
jgi:hypothetical protein